jgi:hypothetical protein
MQNLSLFFESREPSQSLCVYQCGYVSKDRGRARVAQGAISHFLVDDAWENTPRFHAIAMSRMAVVVFSIAI